MFRSWQNPRAKEYRRIYEIPDHIGTAVNVQAMVFGNTGDRSGTGVGFTRNPATGAKEFYGEFLINAQGEDVVAGIRTPKPIAELETGDAEGVQAAARRSRRASRSTTRTSRTSSSRSRTTSCTCCRRATASAPATPRSMIATDLVAEKLITPKDAVLMVEPEALSQLLAPIFDPKDWKALPVATKGLPASPGAASGQVVFTADRRGRVDAAGQEGRCSSARRPCPTTSTACSSRRAFSRRRAA